MVAVPPRPPGPAPVPWRPSLEVFAIQLLVIGLGVAMMRATPLGLSPLFFWATGAMLFGAWAWAVRIGRPQGLLERPALRVVARRPALLGGGSTGVLYVAVAAVPGQLELPWLVVFVMAGVLAAGGGFASLVLTLCGFDAARSGAPPQAR